MKSNQIRSKILTLLLFEIAIVVMVFGIFSSRLSRLGGVPIQWVVGLQPLVFYFALFPFSKLENKYKIGEIRGVSLPSEKELETMNQDEAWRASSKGMIRFVVSLFLLVVAWVWAVYLAPIVFS